MHIPSDLPRFEKGKAVLVSTGKQVGKVYFASKGMVAEIASIEVPTPEYSDREGFFVRSGAGRRYGSGSVFEPKDVETKRRFLRQFSAKLKEISKDREVDEVYVFSPNYAMKELKEGLPPDLKKKLRFSFMGNFVRFGPMELLRKINERFSKLREKNEIRKPEEIKILSRPKFT